MALQKRKRIDSSSLLQFIFGDWRVITQTGFFLFFAFLIESAREIFSLYKNQGETATISEGTTNDFWAHALLLLETNFFTALCLFIPALLFIFAGKCLVPQASSLLKRIFALILFMFYVAFTLIDANEGASATFRWSVDKALRSSDIFSAAAAAIILGSLVLVVYRFVSSAKGIFSGFARLMLAAFIFGALIFSDRLSQPHFPALDAGPVSRLKMILIFNDLSFAESNSFLTQELDDSVQNSIHYFRPVVMSSPSFVSQLATLFSGKPPFAHGVRTNDTSGTSWELFKKSLSYQLLRNDNATDFHFTNITSPSEFAEFSPSTIAGTRCPSRTGSPLVYQRLDRIHERVSSFVPRFVIQKLVPLSACVPLKIPVDDLVHQEMMNQMAPAHRSSNALTSIWSIDLSMIQSPIGNSASMQAPSDQTGQNGQNDRDAAKTGNAKKRNLALLLRSILKNLELLGLAEVTEIHIVGLAPQSAQSAPKSSDDLQYGSYIYVQPGNTRSSPWPLADENRLTGLAQVGKLLFSHSKQLSSSELHGQGNDSKRARPPLEEAETIYAEWLLPASKAKPAKARANQNDFLTEKQLALLTKRFALCSSGSNEATPPSLNFGVLEELYSGLIWSEKTGNEYQLENTFSSERCRKEIINSIEVSLSHDIHLLEPYSPSKELLEFASTELDDAIEGSNSP